MGRIVLFPCAVHILMVILCSFFIVVQFLLPFFPPSLFHAVFCPLRKSLSGACGSTKSNERGPLETKHARIVVVSMVQPLILLCFHLSICSSSGMCVPDDFQSRGQIQKERVKDGKQRHWEGWNPVPGGLSITLAHSLPRLVDSDLSTRLRRTGSMRSQAMEQGWFCLSPKHESCPVLHGRESTRKPSRCPSSTTKDAPALILTRSDLRRALPQVVLPLLQLILILILILDRTVLSSPWRQITTVHGLEHHCGLGWNLLQTFLRALVGPFCDGAGPPQTIRTSHYTSAGLRLKHWQNEPLNKPQPMQCFGTAARSTGNDRRDDPVQRGHTASWNSCVVLSKSFELPIPVFGGRADD